MDIMSARLADTFQKPLVFREEEGTGAAGGIGYGLSLAYDTKFVPGFSFVSKWFEFREIDSKCRFNSNWRRTI